MKLPNGFPHKTRIFIFTLEVLENILFLRPYGCTTGEKSSAHGLGKGKNNLYSTEEHSYSFFFVKKNSISPVSTETKFQIAHTQGNFKEVRVFTHHNTGPTYMRKFEKNKVPTPQHNGTIQIKVFKQHNKRPTSGNYKNLNILTPYNIGPTHKGTLKISNFSHTTVQGPHTQGAI